MTIILMLCVAFVATAQKVTLHVVDQPAATVFRQLMEQTGKNFVYSSAVLENVKVSVDARNMPLKKVLARMFDGTDIEFTIKGDNVVLKRKRRKPEKVGVNPGERVVGDSVVRTRVLDEVIVVSRLEAPAVETADLGAKKLTAGEIISTPVLFGESDVVKALQLQPGVAEGLEGFAGMHVHGGNADENLYMLDNVPLYQVNHFAGLFSAFNAEAIRYIDFFKSSVPAQYDGRLSSFLDVRTKNGSPDGHHGSARLGLTAGALNIDGPIGGRTTYSVALRRSWFEVLTIPMMAIINSDNADEKTRMNYYFMDLNAKVNHRFSDRATGFVGVYFGDDYLRTGTKDKDNSEFSELENDKYDFHWGNLLVHAGLNYRFRPDMTAEFTAAFTRYFSSMKHDDLFKNADDKSVISHSVVNTDNHINDWILRGDFRWEHTENSHIRFGAGYTRHNYLPSRTSRHNTIGTESRVSRDSTWSYNADELNAYFEDDWQISPLFRINAGLHASLFYIDGKVHYGLSPRLSASFRPARQWAVKGAYSRTTQYVHQLSQSYLSLPSDQWVPVTGRFKPQTADKIALGACWMSADSRFAVTAEAYYKWMHNLVEYRDEYYLHPPMEVWNSRLTSGRGSARGIDLKLEKVVGRLSGHIAYSLAWADRRFPDKNGGKTYPARFDNRHTINLLLNWEVSGKVSLNAAWTGHSGNRFTLLSKMWEGPGFGEYPNDQIPLRAPINNYKLPFYHRLDMSCTVKNRRGYWTFSLYNAYCHMNTVAIRRDYTTVVKRNPDGSVWHESKPVFQKVKLLPVIPSVSYSF